MKTEHMFTILRYNLDCHICGNDCSDDYRMLPVIDFDSDDVHVYYCPDCSDRRSDFYPVEKIRIENINWNLR